MSYLQKCKVITFEKITNHIKYKYYNIPSLGRLRGDDRTWRKIVTARAIGGIWDGGSV